MQIKDLVKNSEYISLREVEKFIWEETRFYCVCKYELYILYITCLYKAVPFPHAHFINILQPSFSTYIKASLSQEYFVVINAIPRIWKNCNFGYVSALKHLNEKSTVRNCFTEYQ